MKNIVRKSTQTVFLILYFHFGQFTMSIFSDVPDSYDDTNFQYIRELLNEKKTSVAQAEINKHLITYPSHPTLLLFQAETWIIQGEKSYISQDFIIAYDFFKKANTLWANHPLVKLRLNELKNLKLGINAIQDTIDYSPKKKMDFIIEPEESEEEISDKKERVSRKKKDLYSERSKLHEKINHKKSRKKLRNMIISPNNSSKERKRQENLLLFADEISRNIIDLQTEYQIMSTDLSMYEEDTDRKLETLEKKLDEKSDTFATKETLYTICLFMVIFISFLIFLIMKLMGDINKILFLFIKKDKVPRESLKNDSISLYKYKNENF